MSSIRNYIEIELTLIGIKEDNRILIDFIREGGKDLIDYLEDYLEGEKLSILPIVLETLEEDTIEEGLIDLEEYTKEEREDLERLLEENLN